MSAAAEALKMLHDRLRYVLEDPTGHMYHEEEFEREFDAAIEEAEARAETRQAASVVQAYTQLPPCISSDGHRFTVNYPPAGMFVAVMTVCERCGRKV